MLTLARDKNKWQYMAEAQEYEPLRKQLFDEYEDCCKDKGIPEITFEDEMLFFKTGNRAYFEKKYFDRRRQLSVYALLCLLYNKEEYLKKLEDVIFAICNEYSWCLPAHRAPEQLSKRDGIDLFAAETGLYLAEVKYILGDRLDLVIVDIITKEIKYRIIDSFKNEHCWFETLKSNWASVCGGCVGATLLYEDLDAFMQVKDRIEKCMDNYLDSLTEDGGCSEGANYWVYGYGYYVLYNDLLRNHTRGIRDNFKNEKVKKSAGFLSSIFLDDKNVAMFADCPAEVLYYMALPYFLNKEYCVSLPPFKNASITAFKLPWAIRSFLCYNPNVNNEKKTEKVYYDKLGWYIERHENYGFAIKGGHNDEEHNHNDIGSFVLTNKGNVIFAELGSGEYTKTYFSSERYTVLNTSSLGHSVPILDGEAQKAGREFYSTMTVDENGVTVDMTRAYPTKDKKIIRNCKITHNKFILTDEFNKNTSITERFILLSEPDIKKDGKVIICGVPVSYSDGFNVSIDIVDNMAYNKKRKVYLLDFTPISEVDRFELSADLEG